MAELKSLETMESAAAKDRFINEAGVKKKANKKFTVRKLSDPSGRFSKIMTFGDFGTGKTYALADLLEAGEKIFAICTDTGGDGITPTITPELIRRGRPDLLDNIVVVVLDNHEDVELFTTKPTEIYPEIYDENFTMVVWDGFSNWQMYHLSESLKNDPALQNDAGEVITLQYWGAVKDATMGTLNRFLYMSNRKTGQVWHKYVTALETQEATAEAIANTTDPKERMKLQKPVKAPLVQGSAAKLIGPAFDIIFRCVAKSVKDEKTGKRETKYYYMTATTDKMKVKARGIKFADIEEAVFSRIWKMVKEQMGMSNV